MENNGVQSVLMEVAEILNDVFKDEGLFINYAKIYYGVMKFLEKVSDGRNYQFPIDIKSIYEKLNIEIQKENLNGFMGEGDPQKVNRIIGKISIRPDYISEGSKISIYVEENEPPAMINYALAHELCHLILNYKKQRYTDEYCTMPMLPKIFDELVADTFAVFLLIPFDKFLETFKAYIHMAKEKGDIPISTEEWLNYLGSVAAVPYYYVACAYQQIRHVAYLMYHIHIADAEEKQRYHGSYGDKVMELYGMVKSNLDEETIKLLYQ